MAIYAFWRFLNFRMDFDIASNPLPSADAAADPEDDVKVAASRLRTLMPLLRAMAGSVILVVGGLLVLSELGVNITPLIAGASVFGLAVSFGSQSLVRDVVSGIFFLAEDAFRIGEYVDCSKVKGTVEGFSVRCLKLRHQNGQLHIVPFGQVMHITNFSRDWTVVKFNLAFAPGTDVELLRKAVKKIGTRHDGGAALQADPDAAAQDAGRGRHQGLLADRALQVHGPAQEPQRHPAHGPSAACTTQLPKLGIQFATPTYPFAMPAPSAVSIAAVPPHRPPPHRPSRRPRRPRAVSPAKATARSGPACAFPASAARPDGCDG